ncbi:hypothetical protein H0H93_004037 [Arthromyces matolae]|nr:hypothetical protein H0H93_004037 [Arthromyces matolae]
MHLARSLFTMRSISLTAILALLAVSNVNALNPRHVEIVHKRQAVATTVTAANAAATGVTIVTAANPTSIPPLSSITFGMPSQATLPVSQTYAAGASAPVSGAPALPTNFIFNVADWPLEDHIPDTDSDQVTEWLKELDGIDIPDIAPTVDGSCVNDTAAAADAANRGWWTCGGYTRSTDIVACPEKYTWGVRTLLSFLNQKNVSATFFVVGSRVVERPQVLIEEYMSGHEISHLTSLTNEQIVAELGWTRHAIRTVLGVTPTTMRPPYGDIDDRVRAISLAMGLIPIMWTRAPDGHQFDTNDWQVAGGIVTGPQSFASFESILSNATVLDTGFIVLEHDLYEQTVDLAIGYTLNAALTHNPPFTLQSIGRCSNIPTSNLYFESNTNTTFPSYNNTDGGYDIDGDGTLDLTKGKKANSGFRHTIPLVSTAIISEFLEAIRTVNPPGRWKILVVDEHSQKLLGSVLKQFDILEENVTLIESISSNRDPQPGFEAIYMLMPTSQNVERIIKDFSGAVKQYAAAHLFFIEGLDEQLFQRLTSSAAEPYLRGLRELFLNFWATEAQVFSIQDPALFFNMYSPPRSDAAFRPARIRVEEDLRFAAKMISNVCISLNEFPFIRYYMPSHHAPLGSLKPHASTRPPPPPETSARWRTNLARGAEARAYEAVDSDHATKLLAFFVQSSLEEHKRQNPEFAKSQPGTPEASRPRATLIITDRTMDLVAPFLHEFTYQAMANDLLPIEDGTKYTYKFQSAVGTYEDKTATLSDNDSVWTELRHAHMREAIDKLMADFNKFLQENAVFKGEGAATLNDMKEMLANLPQYQEQREKFSLHLNMAQECMDIFERRKLPLVANVEQCCATGVTAEGKSPKNLVEEMVPLLDSRDVINTNKVRIIALYIQHRDGVPEEDRRRLYQHARLTLAEQDAVNALVHLGVRINRVSDYFACLSNQLNEAMLQSATDRDNKRKIKQKPSDDEYELSRYKPVVKTIVEEHVAGKLDNSMFPYVKEAPSAAPLPSSLRSPPPQQTSLRSQKPSWHRAPKAGSSQVEIRGRILVFIAGGATFSELRECYQLSAALNKDIYIGSTHTMTPRHFVDDLKALELGGVGSKALPNGLRDRPGQRSPQEYYDEKYHTKDAPPPQRAAAAPREPERRLQAPKMSPANSFASSVNSASTPSVKEEKKKKKGGLFRF